MGGCLSVGSNAAKTLAAALNKPLVGVHHMVFLNPSCYSFAPSPRYCQQAHALTSMLTSPPDQLPQYPFLTLLISGGHTLLLLARSPTSFETLATSNDESIGQSFDSVSRLLRLPWSSLGPGDALEKFCLSSPELHGTLPPLSPPFPHAVAGRLEFSYSSFHSHVERYLAMRGGVLDDVEKLALARGFQHAAVAHLEEKLLLGLQWCQDNSIQVGHLVVSGGVASNTYLRERLAEVSRVEKTLIYLYIIGWGNVLIVWPRKVTHQSNWSSPHLHFAQVDTFIPFLCSYLTCSLDNAVMVAWASMHRFLAGDTDDYTIALLHKWKIEDLLKSEQELLTPDTPTP